MPSRHWAFAHRLSFKLKYSIQLWNARHVHHPLAGNFLEAKTQPKFENSSGIPRGRKRVSRTSSFLPINQLMVFSSVQFRILKPLSLTLLQSTRRIIKQIDFGNSQCHAWKRIKTNHFIARCQRVGNHNSVIQSIFEIFICFSSIETICWTNKWILDAIDTSGVDDVNVSWQQAKSCELTGIKSSIQNGSIRNNKRAISQCLPSNRRSAYKKPPNVTRLVVLLGKFQSLRLKTLQSDCSLAATPLKTSCSHF